MGLGVRVDMPLPSFVQHLSVLEHSRLVKSPKCGRVRTYEIAPERFNVVEDCLTARRQSGLALRDSLQLVPQRGDDCADTGPEGGANQRAIDAQAAFVAAGVAVAGNDRFTPNNDGGPGEKSKNAAAQRTNTRADQHAMAVGLCFSERSRRGRRDDALPGLDRRRTSYRHGHGRRPAAEE